MKVLLPIVVICGVLIVTANVGLINMSESPKVLWIVIDCLRYDAFSSNGYHRPTTTAIDDRLESDFAKFSDASTQSGFTLNVISSMMTGTYPTTHGILRWSDKFPTDLPTYREMVRDSGLGPAEAVAGMNFITDEWGVNNAFDNVHNLDAQKSERDCDQAVASEVRTQAEEIFDTREDPNALLWFFDLHTPWLSESTFNGSNPKRDHYDSELQYVSAELETLFTRIEEQGVYDDTVIILTGDHGDIFDEYQRLPWNRYTTLAEKVPGLHRFFDGDGYLGHLGRPFFEELVHVPLYIKLPDSRLGGETVHGQVELIDIIPTICELADIDLPETVEGESLLPRIEGRESGKDFVRAEMGPNPADGLIRMIRDGNYKYIKFDRPSIQDINEIRADLLPYLGRRFFTPPEVLLERSSEDENVIHSHPDMASRMENKLPEQTDGRIGDDGSAISDDKREELENLGYL